MILFYHFIVFLETGYLFVCKSIIFHISVLCFSNLYFNHRIYVSWILICAKSVLLVYLSCMYLYMAKMDILRTRFFAYIRLR